MDFLVLNLTALFLYSVQLVNGHRWRLRDRYRQMDPERSFDIAAVEVDEEAAPIV